MPLPHPQHVREFFADPALSTQWRTLRLAWSEAQQPHFRPMLLPQRAFITEGVCEPTEARIDCLALSAQLPLEALPGEPFALQMLTEAQGLRSFPLVLTEARLGPQRARRERGSGPMRGVIRLNDPTSHGGRVVSASDSHRVLGLGVARVGDRCTCPRKGHAHCVIAEGDPAVTLGGRPVAFEGHRTSCGAVLLSTAPRSGRP